MKKFVVGLFAFLILGIVVFYFWGSSGFNDPEDYDKLVTYSETEGTVGDTISVMTYNIGYLSGMTNNLPVDRDEQLFSQNLDKSIRLLELYNFDFIGLQEIDFNSSRSFQYNQMDSLGFSLDFHQGAYAVNWDKSYVPFPYFPITNHFGRMFSGQAILSKVKILDNNLEVLQKPINAPFYYNAFYIDRILQTVKVQLNNDTLILMNVHLEAFDKETRELHAERVLVEFRKYATDYPVVLMGDFNSRPPFASDISEREKTVEIFLDEPNIREAISKDRYLSNEAKYFTFDTADPYERLDYIFYNYNKIMKIDSDVVRRASTISDHLPVWMTFTVIP
jgi:endonuclease/exonuclease/phosphatase family metal-dependent hydrolase